LLIGEGFRRRSAIAERLGVSRQAVHQSLKDLIDLEVVELVPDPRDGRAKLAQLSRKGAPIHRKARKILEKLEAELGSRIGNQRVTTLRKVLEQDWGEPVIFD
jgi:DNA-binding MarR family transcriptional regulator